MTNVVVNPNATIKGINAAGEATPGVATLGGMIYQLAVLGIRSQADTTLNPQRFDYLSVSEDREEKIQGVVGNNGGVCTIDYTPPCQTIFLPFTQPTQLTVPDFLLAPSIGYTVGTGGTPTFSATAWTTALADAIRLLHWLQLKLEKNPLSLTLVENWQIASSKPPAVLDAELQATVKIPLQAFSDGLGGWRYAGLSPLGNLQ